MDLDTIKFQENQLKRNSDFLNIPYPTEPSPFLSSYLPLNTSRLPDYMFYLIIGDNTKEKTRVGKRYN